MSSQFIPTTKGLIGRNPVPPNTLVGNPTGVAGPPVTIPMANLPVSTATQAALDGKAASSHAHGSITNAGAIGSTANLPLITGASGVVGVGAFGTAANTFAEGDKVPTKQTIIAGNPIEANRKFSFVLGTDDRAENGGYQNITESWGYNLGRPNATEPETYFTIESKYWFNNVGPYVTEVHLQGTTIEGTFWRTIYCVMPRAIADLAVSQIELRTQKFRLADFSGNEKILFDFNNSAIEYRTSLSHFVPNNYALMRQHNAAADTYIHLPYINSSDQLLVQSPVRHTAVHSTGLGQNSAYYMQGVGTFPSGSFLVEHIGPALVTGNLGMLDQTASATGVLFNRMWNQNTTANSKAMQILNFSSTTGKALVQHQSAATGLGFETGYDAATESYIVSTIDGSGNSANWYMWINRTTAAATFTGSLKVHGNCGFNNVAPIAKPTVTGSRGGNAALASLLTALSDYGLITDSTS